MTKIQELKDYVIRALVQTHAESDRTNIERYVNRRMLVVLKDILPIATSSVRHSHYLHDDTVKLINATLFRKSWGQMTLNKKQVDAPGLLMHILFDVLETGHTSIGSAVRIKEATMDALMEYAIEENNDLAFKLTFDFTGKDVFETPVNVQSLRSYVTKLEHDSTMLPAKRLRNLSIAKAILASLTAVPGQMLLGKQQPDVYVLVQEATFADSGRCYLKGLNLQNCPKEVRHAALGHCHLYDMRAGVFGVLAALAKAYYTKATGEEVEFHKIKNYIRHKEQIRMRITSKLWPDETRHFENIGDYKGFHGFYKVKVALTAIGFGAKKNASASWKNQDGMWQASSLRRTFKSKELVERFLQSDLVKELMDEFKAVTDIILLQLNTDVEFAGAFAVEGLKDSQKLAMVYQGTESAILGEVMQLAAEYGLLLPAHDGVYVKHSFNLADMHYKLKVPFNMDKSYIQFDHSQIGLATPVSHESDHRRAIAAQEHEARDYMPTHSTIQFSASGTPVKKEQLMTSWGLVDAALLHEHL